MGHAPAGIHESIGCKAPDCARSLHGPPGSASGPTQPQKQFFRGRPPPRRKFAADYVRGRTLDGP